MYLLVHSVQSMFGYCGEVSRALAIDRTSRSR
jgi:hypothetical protein